MPPQLSTHLPPARPAADPGLTSCREWMCRSWRLALGCSFHTVALTRSSSKDTESPGKLTAASLDSRLCSCLAGRRGVGDTRRDPGGRETQAQRGDWGRGGDEEGGDRRTGRPQVWGGPAWRAGDSLGATACGSTAGQGCAFLVGSGLGPCPGLAVTLVFTGLGAWPGATRQLQRRVQPRRLQPPQQVSLPAPVCPPLPASARLAPRAHSLAGEGG